MSNPAKVARWTAPDGQAAEHHFPAGHSDRERRDFLLGLFADPKRLPPGGGVIVANEPEPKRKRGRKR